MESYNEKGEPEFDPVACFAVVTDPSDPDHDLIIGQTNSIAMDGGEFEELPNFAGYYHDSDFEVLGKKLNSAAFKRFKCGGF